MTPLVRNLVFALFACAGFLGVRLLTTPALVTSPAPHFKTIPTVRIGLPPLTAEGSAFIAEWKQFRGSHGGTETDFSALFLKVKEIGDPYRRRAFNGALLTEWAATDPVAALAFLKGKDMPDSFQVAREWLRRDPQTAISALLAGDESTHLKLTGLLNDVATLAPARLAEVISALPKSQSLNETYVQDAFAAFAEKDPNGARTIAESIQGPRRGQVLAGVARAWAIKDGPTALAWAQGLDAGDSRDAALAAALTGWAKADPLAALGKIDLAPPGKKDMLLPDTGALILREAATRDWAGTLGWLRENPGKLGSSSLDGMRDILAQRLEADVTGTLQSLAQGGLPDLHQLLSNSFMSCPEQHDAVWQWLDQQPLNAFTRSAREAILYSMAWTEPESAIASLEKLPDTEENRPFFEKSFRDLMPWSRSNRFEDLLASVSPKLRPYLLENGFILEVRNGNTDPAAWLSRLEELPAERRLNAVGGLARGWAVNDPEAAASWASSLTDPVQRAKALDGAVGAWAGADISASSQWVDSLPAGETRDTAAQGLVGALIKSAPESAWTWALSIQTPNQRLNALQLAYTSLNQKDAGMARQFLQSANLSDAEIAAVQRPPGH